MPHALCQLIAGAWQGKSFQALLLTSDPGPLHLESLSAKGPRPGTGGGFSGEGALTGVRKEDMGKAGPGLDASAIVQEKEAGEAEDRGKLSGFEPAWSLTGQPA